MSIDTNSPVAITEAEEISIRAAANQLIANAAVKNGWTFEQVPEQAKADAYTSSRNAYLEQKALKANPLWQTLEAEREAHRLTKATLAATQQVRPSPVNGSRDTGPDPNVIRARMGEDQWWSLTNDGRLMACGVDPASVTQVEITEAKRVFGKGTDSTYANNLSKQDWARYRHLKRIAIVMGLQGK